MESTVTKLEAPRRRRTLRDLFRDIRGTATSEAVIMLPFFVIVWGCVIYVSHKYERAVEVQASARHCAWRYAKDNCEGDAACGISEGADMSSSTEAAESTNDIENASNSTGGWGFAGRILDVLAGKEVTATTSADVTKPEVIGGGSTHLVGQLALTCNVKPSGDLGDIISSAWSSLWHGL